MAGEADIIQGFFAPLAAGFPGAFGLKDDAGAIQVPDGFDIVVTVDAIAAGVHFFPDDEAASVGWKALAVNVSDLIAKGAAPSAYVMSLAFPDAPDAAWLTGFAAGLAQAQRAFGISLMGGDTDRRPGPVSITITAFGFVPRGQMVKRSTAKPGDHIFVSGSLGDSALGLRLRLEAAAGVGLTVSAVHRGDLIERYLRPKPPLALIPALRNHASASMDISDGLMKDLMRMSEASGVGALADCGALPLSAAARAVAGLNASAFDTIITGGDDYEVLATVAPGNVAGFVAEAGKAGVSVTEIGRIIEGSGVVFRGLDGKPMHLAKPGYDHF